MRNDQAELSSDQVYNVNKSTPTACRQSLHLDNPPAITLPVTHSESLAQKDSTGNNDLCKVVVVDWASETDRQNPRNWPKWRKWLATILMSVLAFVGPFSSAMTLPAFPIIMEELHVEKDIGGDTLMSSFHIGYAVGPFIWSPLSEVFGRKWILIISITVFVGFSLGSCFAQTTDLLILCRFMSGTGGSSPIGVGGAVVSDVWIKSERGTALSIYSVCAIIASALGPIVGGFISGFYSWRFCFALAAIIGGVVAILAAIFMSETSHRTILRRRAKKLQKLSGIPHVAINDNPHLGIYRKIGISLARPFKILATQPIVQFVTLYHAFLYSVMQIQFSTFLKMWRTRYNQPLDIAVINFAALSVGYFFAAILAVATIDRLYNHLCRKRGFVECGRPELRLPALFVSVPLMTIGEFWYGWCAERSVFWLLPDIGAVIAAIGAGYSYVLISLYIVDSYSVYTASALAVISLVRSLCAFAFPLFVPFVIKAIGYGWTGTLLGLVGLVLGLPFTWLLWKYGPYLRQRSSYADSSDVPPQ